MEIKLEGKAKELFWNWFLEKFKHTPENGQYYNDGFYNLPISMQIGVYIEWLDSESIRIITLNKMKVFPNIFEYYWRIGGIETGKRFNNRQKSQIEAINKGIEFINSKNG